MKNKQKISPKQKALILAEAEIPGCVVSKLAKLHGISKGTIYTWMKKSQDLQINKSNAINSSIDNSFVEINLINSKSHKNSTLQKASIVFNNFSFLIEGNIEVASLLKILKVLEEIC